jgi:glycerate kinase
VHVLIAPAPFKGSLSAAAAAEAMVEGAHRAAQELGHPLELDVVPLADGGEGTVDAVQRARGGTLRHARVRDPLGRPIEAAYLLLDDGTAVLEMAAASGLPLLAPQERDPLRASTHGTGDLIAAALDAGARRLIIGVGGSATVDGGAGMAEALGVRLLDDAGHPLPPGGGALLRLAHVDLSGLHPGLREVESDVLCDVQNPLVGPHGAARVFGPQKGATPAMVETLDSALGRLGEVLERAVGRPLAQVPGAGAAGGLAAGLAGFLGARLRPGIDVILDLLDVPRRLRAADLALTGEGQLDQQTSGGKVIAGLALAAHEAGVPVVAIAGRVVPQARELYTRGLHAAFSLADGPRSLEECEAHGADLLARASENVLRLWLAAGDRRQATGDG